MAEHKGKSAAQGGVAGLIRSHIGTETNTRFLRALPLFKAESDHMPERLRNLLSQLEKAELGYRSQ